MVEMKGSNYLWEISYSALKIVFAAEKGDAAKKDAENDLNKENNGTAEENENNITVEEKDSNTPVKDGQKEIVEKLEKLAVKDIASKDSGEAKCDSASSKDD